MTTDDTIRKLLKELKERREEVLEELEGEEDHGCNCEYCDYVEDIDEETEIKLNKELEKIDADIARYSALKLSEEI